MKTLHIRCKCNPLKKEDDVVYRLKENYYDIIINNENETFTIDELLFTISKIQEKQIKLKVKDEILTITDKVKTIQIEDNDINYTLTFRLSK